MRARLVINRKTGLNIVRMRLAGLVLGPVDVVKYS